MITVRGSIGMVDLQTEVGQYWEIPLKKAVINIVLIVEFGHYDVVLMDDVQWRPDWTHLPSRHRPAWSNLIAT